MVNKVLDPIDAHVGSRVKMRRLIQNMSQEKLGDALGITFQQIQKYEKGTNRISSSRLIQIANALHVRVEFFFEDAPGKRKTDGSAPSPAYVSKFLASTDGLALARAFTSVSNKELRQKIVAVVKEIAGED